MITAKPNGKILAFKTYVKVEGSMEFGHIHYAADGVIAVIETRVNFTEAFGFGLWRAQ